MKMISKIFSTQSRKLEESLKLKSFWIIMKKMMTSTAYLPSRKKIEPSSSSQK